MNAVSHYRFYVGSWHEGIEGVLLTVAWQQNVCGQTTGSD